MQEENGQDSDASDPISGAQDNTPSTDAAAKPKSRRQFLKDLAAAGAGIAAGGALLGDAKPAGAQGEGGVSPSLAPSVNAAYNWQPTVSVYSGTADMATGNLQITVPICGWGGKGGGLQFALYHNSESGRTTTLGPKWAHAFTGQIVTTATTATVVTGTSETTYALSGGQYVAPAGIYDTLVKNANNSWTLTRKGNVICQFGADGLLNSMTDLNGNTVTLTYTSGNLTQVTDAAGRVLTLGYTGGLLTSITDCQSRAWTLAYVASRLQTITDPLLNGQTYTRQFAYDANNTLSSFTNRLGKTWQYACDATGVFLSTTDPDTHSWTCGYGDSIVYFPQPAGSWPASQRPAGTVAIATWTDPLAHATKYAMDNLGRLLAYRDGIGYQTNYSYDTANNRLSMQMPSGAMWQYMYDGRGNQLTAQDPAGKQTIRTYDSGDRLLTVTDPLLHQTKYVYSSDGKGNLIKLTDANGKDTLYVVNGAGQTTQMTDPTARVTKYGYDTWGHTSSVTVVKDVNTSFITQFVSDAGSHVTQRTDARSRVTNYGYDAWGRQTSLTYPANTANNVSITLDAESRLTQSSDPTGVRTYGYDVWGRRKSMTDPRGNTAANYDAAGRMQNQTDVTGRQISYGYDNADRLTTVSDDGNVTQAIYTYTSDSNPATLTQPNNTKVVYGYDTVLRLASIAHRKTSDNSLLVSYGGTAPYDDAGRLVSVVETTPTTTATTAYGYTGLNLLNSESRTGANAYDGAYGYEDGGLRHSSYARLIPPGNVPTIVTDDSTYIYDGAGRLTQVVNNAGPTETYAWNDDSTLASYSGPAGGGYTRLLDYDEEQRLIRIRRDYGGGNVQTAYEYGYGFDGKRRWRKDYTQSPTLWTWYPCGVGCEAGDLVEQTSINGGTTWTTSALYLRGLGLIRRRNVATSADEYHHFDLRDTVQLITDSNGTVKLSELYDRFNVRRYAVSGGAFSQWRWQNRYLGEEGMVANCWIAIDRDLALHGNCGQRNCQEELDNCRRQCDQTYTRWTDYYNRREQYLITLCTLGASKFGGLGGAAACIGFVYFVINQIKDKLNQNQDKCNACCDNQYRACKSNPKGSPPDPGGCARKSFPS